jgi:hypothetical protein
VWLLEDGGVAVGHALAGPCTLPHAEVAPGDGELKRLYVLLDHQNGGWAGGCSVPRWSGWSATARARYGLACGRRTMARNGCTRGMAFEHVGDYDFIVGNIRDHEFILRRRAQSPG